MIWVKFAFLWVLWATFSLYLITDNAQIPASDTNALVSVVVLSISLIIPFVFQYLSERFQSNHFFIHFIALSIVFFISVTSKEVLGIPNRDLPQMRISLVVAFSTLAVGIGLYRLSPRVQRTSTAPLPEKSVKRSKRTKPSKAKRFWLAFDTETTGRWGVEHNVAVVQVAAILYDSENQEVHRVVTLVDPERDIPLVTSRLHNIYDDDVVNAPNRQAVRRTLLPLFRRASAVVAHNSTFDKKSAAWLGLEHGNWVCTMRMFNSKFGGKWAKLGEAATMLRLDFDEDQAHSGEYDAEVAAQIYMSLKYQGVGDQNGFNR
jgi:DNA polymerase III epsilon subunit-like protein